MLDAVNSAVAELLKVREGLMECFAKDDEPYRGEDRDTVHGRVRQACKNVLAIQIACQRTADAVGTVVAGRHVED